MSRDEQQDPFNEMQSGLTLEAVLRHVRCKTCKKKYKLSHEELSRVLLSATRFECFECSRRFLDDGVTNAVQR